MYSINIVETKYDTKIFVKKRAFHEIPYQGFHKMLFF